MKKIISLALAALMVTSVLPVAYAADVDYTVGTAVVYTAANNEDYTITVPATLAPGGSGTVTLEGAWAADTLITVTAQENVKLTNSINAADTKTLAVSFAGISEFGSNTESQKFTESVSVEPIQNAIFGTWNGHFYYNVESEVMDTLEQLQAKHEFTYYSTMSTAVNDVNNGTIGASADVDKEDAIAGIYTDDNGGVNVVLLQDTIERARITASADMTINLGGNTLTIENDYYGIVGDANQTNTIKIDGRIDESAIVMNGIDGAGYIINTKTNTFIIDGGSYTINESKVYDGYSAGFLTVPDGGTATVTDANIKVSGIEGPVDAINSIGTLILADSTIMATTSQSYARGISSQKKTTVSNCDIMATSNAGNAYGISNFETATATISNCDIRAYANYLYGDESYYGNSSQGLFNKGTLTLNDCYVKGTHCGLENHGTLYINGGTYEGYGHGGVYFSGPDTTSYVKDATIRQCAMPDGYTATANCNGAGFYIGGDTDRDNISVYMDNCDIYGSSQPIVLRGSSGEQNNSLYISNSTISGAMNIRIDNNTHKLYIGTGNNFTAENTTLAEAVVVTDETYIYNE